MSYVFWWVSSLRPEKKSSSRLSGGYAINYDRKKKDTGGKFSLRREKKSSSRLSGGCVSFWFWREIGNFFVVAGNFHYDRKKKKFQSSVRHVRDQLRPEKKRYRREIFITTGKKKVPVVCLAGVSVFGSGGKLAVFL